MKTEKERGIMMPNQQDIEELLLQRNNIKIAPRGYSMYPVLVPGRDQVIIEPVERHKIKRGDVVLYRRTPSVGGILVIHRIWKCTPEGVYLVGDNQTEIEGPLSRTQIKGIMVGIESKGRYIPVNHPLYRLCTGGWLLLRPFRKGIAAVAEKVKKWVTRSMNNRK